MKLLQEVLASRAWLGGTTFEILQSFEGALVWNDLWQGVTAFSAMPNFCLDHSDLVCSLFSGLWLLYILNLSLLLITVNYILVTIGYSILKKPAVFCDILLSMFFFCLFLNKHGTVTKIIESKMCWSLEKLSCRKSTSSLYMEFGKMNSCSISLLVLTNIMLWASSVYPDKSWETLYTKNC